MNKTYFWQYIDEVDHAFKDYREQIAALKADIDAKRAENRKIQADDSLTREKKAVSAQDLGAAEQEYVKAVVAAMDGANATVARLRKDLESDIAEFLAPKPENVDMSTVALLNSGAMSDTDLVTLAKKHAGSPTMLKLIGKAAEGMLDNSMTARILALDIDKYCSPNPRLEAFDFAAKSTFRGTSPEVLPALGTYWDETAYAAAKANMAAFDTFTVSE